MTLSDKCLIRMTSMLKKLIITDWPFTSNCPIFNKGVKHFRRSIIIYFILWPLICLIKSFHFDEWQKKTKNMAWDILMAPLSHGQLYSDSRGCQCLHRDHWFLLKKESKSNLVMRLVWNIWEHWMEKTVVP